MVELRQPVLRLEHPAHVRRRGGAQPAEAAAARQWAVASVGALAEDEARVPEVLDPELAVVREPAVERLGERLRPVEQVAVPPGRGLDRVVGRGVQQEGVAARALEPARGRAAGSSGSSAHATRSEAKPPGASARGAARRRAPRRRRPAIVSVAEEVRGLGRDDVRRVRDDEVELLALDRLEEAADARLDVRRR